MKYISILCFSVFLISSCNLFSGKNSNSPKPVSTEAEAINQLTKDLKNEPNNAALYFKRGFAYRTAKEDSLALMDFKKATELDSTVSKYYSAVGDLLFDHKDITGSVVWFQKALALNPNDEKAHLKMAKLFLYIEEFPKAFVEINTVLRGNVYSAEAYFLKGMCYKSMKDTVKAISSFQTSVQTDPQFLDAHMQLAMIYEAKKDPIALKYFENAFKVDTLNLEPLYGAAMFWQNQQNYTEAKKVFRRIINSNRSYPKSYYNTGWMLMQEDSTEKAIRQFDIAIENKPDYDAAYYNRGICKEILLQYTDALEDYNQALSFNADNASYKEAKQRVSEKIK